MKKQQRDNVLHITYGFMAITILALLIIVFLVRHMVYNDYGLLMMADIIILILDVYLIHRTHKQLKEYLERI